MNDTKITMKSLARQKADVRAKIARQHSESNPFFPNVLGHTCPVLQTGKFASFGTETVLGRCCPIRRGRY